MITIKIPKYSENKEAYRLLVLRHKDSGIVDDSVCNSDVLSELAEKGEKYTFAYVRSKLSK